MGFWNRFGAEDRTVCGVDWNALARISRKGDLLAQLKSYGMLFTPDDLEEMLVRYGKKLVHVKKSMQLLSLLQPVFRLWTVTIV